ncbi:hypothetical protein GM418_13255 [Maribellus comscasis]|uniref:Uncharacterized protein n=1 Tax=Maribellus comscasis TaxID=2681766 RepID=A0A6I6K3T1_9BACT|nr:hypothetical protein [Maribellus comscasis]QGY44594.1 hypothetical protein GM418_13255 [Maribellus comscasis]
MRKVKTSLVLLALVVISGAVLATGNLKVNIVPGESEKAVVNVTNAAQSQFEIEIKNENGDIVFYKETKSPSTSYKKVYDFSMLEDGHYTFTVKLDKEMETNILDVSNGKVKVVSERKDVEPLFLFKDDEFRVAYLNFAKENVKFYLYDNNTNQLVLEKDLKSDFAINYGLDFSKMKRGSYDAVIAGEKNFYEYKIAID